MADSAVALTWWPPNNQRDVPPASLLQATRERLKFFFVPRQIQNVLRLILRKRHIQMRPISDVGRECIRVKFIDEDWLEACSL